MKLVTLACFSVLGLLGAAAPAAAQAPAAQPPAVQAPAARTGPATARAERRRRSYAACNRASHQRGLRGGKRRRFLIRCRLGFERPRQQPAGQGVQQPVPPPAQGTRPGVQQSSPPPAPRPGAQPPAAPPSQGPRP